MARWHPMIGRRLADHRTWSRQDGLRCRSGHRRRLERHRRERSIAPHKFWWSPQCSRAHSGSVFVIVLVVATARVTLAAAVVHVALLAGALPTLLATSPAAARIPDRVGQHFDDFDGHARVIALDDEFTGSRALLRRFISDDDVDTRSAVQRRWKWKIGRAHV